MPLTPVRILVGRRGSAGFDVAQFNMDAAAASESFFIAARSMNDAGLVERIGTGPASALEETIGETIREAEQARALTACSLKPVKPQQRVTQDFSYSVRLADFGDAVLAKEIADVIQAGCGAARARDPPTGS